MTPKYYLTLFHKKRTTFFTHIWNRSRDPHENRRANIEGFKSNGKKGQQEIM